MRIFLLALAALACSGTASLAQGASPDRFLGLLELPPLCYWDCIDADKPLPLHAAPDSGEAPVLVLTRDMFYIDPEHQDRDSPYWPQTEEYAYERSGAIVYGKQGEWYRIRIGDRDFWVSAAYAGPFHPYPQLLEGQLAYLPSWNFILWDAPGETPLPLDHPFRGDPALDDRIPVRVLDFKQANGRWWVHVEVLEHAPCVSAMENFFAEGWVPAYAASGRRAVWFYSRGC